jgi:hypothetical protein
VWKKSDCQSKVYICAKFTEVIKFCKLGILGNDMWRSLIAGVTVYITNAVHPLCDTSPVQRLDPIMQAWHTGQQRQHQVCRTKIGLSLLLNTDATHWLSLLQAAPSLLHADPGP